MQPVQAHCCPWRCSGEGHQHRADAACRRWLERDVFEQHHSQSHHHLSADLGQGQSLELCGSHATRSPRPAHICTGGAAELHPRYRSARSSPHQRCPTASFSVATECGIRWVRSRALTWAMFSWENVIIAIRRSVTRCRRLKFPKSKKPRVFPISSQIAERLLPLVGGRKPGEPLFATRVRTTKSGKRIAGCKLEPDNSVNRHLTRAIKKPGLGLCRFSRASEAGFSSRSFAQVVPKSGTAWNPNSQAVENACFLGCGEDLNRRPFGL